MPRKPRNPRGAKCLASPAQMARLRTVLGGPFPTPIPFETYRHMMRQHRNPESNVETAEAAWEHLESRDKAAIAMVQDFSQALHAARLASGTPPRGAKM